VGGQRRRDRPLNQARGPLERGGVTNRDPPRSPCRSHEASGSAIISEPKYATGQRSRYLAFGRLSAVVPGGDRDPRTRPWSCRTGTGAWGQRDHEVPGTGERLRLPLRNELAGVAPWGGGLGRQNEQSLPSDAEEPKRATHTSRSRPRRWRRGPGQMAPGPSRRPPVTAAVNVSCGCQASPRNSPLKLGAYRPGPGSRTRGPSTRDRHSRVRSGGGWPRLPGG